jgi:hypothetical protein
MFSHVTCYIETNYKGKRSFVCNILKLGACCKANERVIALCHPPFSHNKTVNLSGGHTGAKVAVINFSKAASCFKIRINYVSIYIYIETRDNSYMDELFSGSKRKCT